jgi:hypothetical protein
MILAFVLASNNKYNPVINASHDFHLFSS